MAPPGELLRLRLVAGSLLVIGIAAAGCTPNSEPSNPTSSLIDVGPQTCSTHTFGPSPTVPWEPLQDLGSQVGVYASTRDDVYAGWRLDLDRQKLLVFRKPSAEFDAELKKRVNDARIELRDAPYSFADLRQFTVRIENDESYWSSRGIKVIDMLPRSDGAAVIVAVSDPTKAKQEMPKRYPDMSLNIVAEEDFVICAPPYVPYII